MVGLVSDDDEVVQPLHHPSVLADTMEICRLWPLSIVEAMERLPLPAHCPRGRNSPNLAEIICRVLANNSHGIIGGNLAVDSSRQGYWLEIEVEITVEAVRKLEHWSHFSLIFLLWTLPSLYLPLHFPFTYCLIDSIPLSFLCLSRPVP